MDGGRARHFVLIPSYNAGRKLAETVAAALRYGWPVWVVIDGSTDGSEAGLRAHENLRVIRRGRNGGKGAAVLDGLVAAAASGFSHALVMDSDGQHPAWLIPEFIGESCKDLQAMILGVPVFGRDAPVVRVVWRRVSNALVNLETGGGIGDSLFGFRVYPVAALLGVMGETRGMRGFDFDAEAVVRLAWRGVGAVNVAAPVRYFRKAEGGVTQFRYLRDNLLLGRMHARLMAGALRRGGVGRWMVKWCEKWLAAPRKRWPAAWRVRRGWPGQARP